MSPAMLSPWQLSLGVLLLCPPRAIQGFVTPATTSGLRHAKPILAVRTQCIYQPLPALQSRSRGTTLMTAVMETSAAPAPGLLAGTSLDQPVVVLDGNYLDTQEMEYQPRELNPVLGLRQWLTFRFKPLGRIQSGSILEIALTGSLGLSKGAAFGGPPSITGVCQGLLTAAHDPRISAVLMKVEGLAASTASLQELRRHMRYFRQSGKKLYGFAPRTLDVNMLYALGGCSKRMGVPEAYVDLTGFSVPVDFLRGVLDKVGVEPQVQRIGEYKSFGDRFSRFNMSDAQRETMQALLDSVSTHKMTQLAADANSTVSALEELMEGGPLSIQKLLDFGLIDDVAYEDQVYAGIKAEQKKNRFKPVPGKEQALNVTTWSDIRASAKPAPPLRRVDLNTYTRKLRRIPVRGIPGMEGDRTVAVIVAEGAIVASAGGGPGGGSNLVVEQFAQMVQRAARDPRISGVVVRVNSPGGDALASDLMWRQVRILSESGKPVVASIGPVAASGGYYIAMGCDKIVAEEQSITGSIGVVSAKFQLGKLFEKAGYSVERLSKGKFAEVLAYERGFTPEEAGFFSQSAMQAYENFVGKAARSRGMPLDVMHRRAQGRVWTGAQGKALGLVDQLGGLSSAVILCREMVEEAAEKRRKEGKQGFMANLRLGGEEGEEAKRKRMRHTKVKYLEPPTNPLASLLALAGGPLGQASTLSSTPASLDAAMKAAGRPIAILDETVGRAFPGISGVPDDLQALGLGPLSYYLLGSNPQVANVVVQQLQKIGLDALLEL